MKQYLDLVRHVMDHGERKEDRTGTGTISVFGYQTRFDLRRGFPLVTTKKMHLKSIIHELLWFIRGETNVKPLQENGVTIWDEWADDKGELGPVYGHQWRKWQASDGRRIDQISNVVEEIRRNPSSRRLIVSAWNPADVDKMALPPCHLLYQFLPNAAARELSLCLYVRSNDIGLGAPFNLCEAGVLVALAARLTGYTPRWLTYFIGDAHIYENQLGMLREQLSREPLPPPRLRISDRIPAFAETGQYEPEWLDRVEPGDFMLENYQHHPPLTAPMAV